MQTCVSEMRTTTMVSSLNLMMLQRWARLLWITVTMGVEGKQQWIQHMVTLEGNWLWVSEWRKYEGQVSLDLKHSLEKLASGFDYFSCSPSTDGDVLSEWSYLSFRRILQNTCTLSTGRNGMQLWQYHCAKWQMWEVYWNCQWLILGTGMKEKVGWGPATDRSLRK